MVDVEQVLQDEMRIYGPSFASEVDAPSTPLWTGVDGAETASSEYYLDLKTNLSFDGAGWKGVVCWGKWMLARRSPRRRPNYAKFWPNFGGKFPNLAWKFAKFGESFAKSVNNLAGI